MKSSLSNDEIGIIYTSKFKGNHHSQRKMSGAKAKRLVASGSILWLYLEIKKIVMFITLVASSISSSI